MTAEPPMEVLRVPALELSGEFVGRRVRVMVRGAVIEDVLRSVRQAKDTDAGKTWTRVALTNIRNGHIPIIGAQTPVGEWNVDAGTDVEILP